MSLRAFPAGLGLWLNRVNLRGVVCVGAGPGLLGCRRLESVRAGPGS